MDELLVVLGYQVRSSNMAEVAQKLELLDELMGNAQGDGLSQLAYKTVHYNLSDLSTWLQSMLSEFNPLPINGFDPMVPHATDAVAPPTPLDDSLLAPAESSTITSIDFDQQNSINHSVFEDSSSSNYDLKAIPSKVMYKQLQSHSQSWTAQIKSPSSRDAKQLKLSSASNSNPDTK